MPEYHAGTDVQIPDGIPMSAFRSAIPNPKRYMKHNIVSISDVCDAAYTGDVELLEEMLATGNEKMLYNGDLNAHVSNITALMMASMSGQTECVELLLRARADPHLKECMKHGQDPEDGRTSLDFAKDAGYDDIMEILEQAENDQPFGWYVPSGKNNNAKIYNCWQWGKKPQKGFYSSRPGAAEYCGFDPMKYGTGPLPEENEEEDFVEPGAVAGAAPRPKPVAAVPAGPPPVNVGLLFPGQGSQYVKMLEGLKDNQEVREMIAIARRVLGYDLLEICLNGPEEKLEETSVCQPAVFLGGMAGLVKLRQQRPEAVESPGCMAGLSLGEYTALCAAGVFTFEEGMELVKVRGEAMAEAASSRPQNMLSVAGLDQDVLEELCAAQLKGDEVCQIANVLFPKGFAVAGTKKAVEAVQKAATEKGAMQARMLKTSGAFHTKLMEPARARLEAALQALLPKMKPPRCDVYLNVIGKKIKAGTPPSDIVPLLGRQLVSPVLWDPSVRLMIKDGMNEFYEVGPMKQLKAMMKRIDPDMWSSTTNIDV